RTPGVDRDGDGIPDAEDACPTEPGRASPDDARKNGCPQYSRVIVSESSVQILQQIQFDKDKDTIRVVSRPILDAVTQTLRENPKIRAPALDGHSSSEEKDPGAIAARGAGAVRAALLAQGVKTELNVKSFGDTRPIVPNNTEEGRAKNRRVEFHI